MTNVNKGAIAACAGTIALACTVVQPANAADIPAEPQYGGPPVEEGYGYREPPRAYRYAPAPPTVYYEPAPPAVVVLPEPYYVPRRRVYVDPGYSYGAYDYGAYGYGYRYRPYIAGGYAYHRGGWGHGPRRW